LCSENLAIPELEDTNGKRGNVGNRKAFLSLASEKPIGEERRFGREK
jgi:hypothetical protein